VVDTKVLSEAEANRIEQNPDKVDLVIRFRDAQAILNLAQRPDADVVQLLLENLVQISGNFGHMFKFGAIGKHVQAVLSGMH
jgi:negative regulator of genetic competence, sporulation and motility